MRNSKEKGITLIALIITIIVLLILAGVSISMVAGDNGILTQAVNAANSNNLAEVKSDLSLALASCQTNYFADRYGDVGTDANVANYFTTSKIKTEMGSNYSSVKGTINIGSESTLTITKTDGKVYKAVILISDVGGVTVSSIVESGTSSSGVAGISASDIAENPSMYYGAVVTNYGTDENKSGSYEWKIFYAGKMGEGTDYETNTNNIYLITSNCISAGDAPEKNESSPVNNNSIYLYNIVSNYTGAENVNTSLWTLNSLYYSNYSTNTNTQDKASAYLLDDEVWSIFMNTKYAEYTIGGPSIELWTASWNSNGYGYEEFFCNYVDSKGYLIGFTSPASSWSEAFSSYEGYSNTLYFSGSSYWLSSPLSSYTGGTVGKVGSNGQITGSGIYTTDCGCRPVTCLNSDVQLIDNEDGTYSIIE